jgi:hypothetical protein
MHADPRAILVGFSGRVHQLNSVATAVAATPTPVTSTNFISTAVPYPIYPGIPRVIQTIQLERTCSALGARKLNRFSLTTVKIYYQVGRSQGVDPAPEKWSP